MGRGDRAYAVLFQPDKITRLKSRSTVPSEGSIPASGWVVTETLDNPLGVVPVVPIVNRGRLLDLTASPRWTTSWASPTR